MIPVHLYTKRTLSVIKTRTLKIHEGTVKLPKDTVKQAENQFVVFKNPISSKLLLYSMQDYEEMEKKKN